MKKCILILLSLMSTNVLAKSQIYNPDPAVKKPFIGSGKCAPQAKTETLRAIANQLEGETIVQITSIAKIGLEGPGTSMAYDVTIELASAEITKWEILMSDDCKLEDGPYELK